MSYCVAKAGEAHTIAERVKQCIIDVVGTVTDEKFSNILMTLPLSDDTVSRRIHEMSTGIKNEVTT
jgi:hypothetical protein